MGHASRSATAAKHKAGRKSGRNSPLRYNEAQYIGGLLLPFDRKNLRIP